MADSLSEDVLADPPVNPGADVEMGDGAGEETAVELGDNNNASNGAELPFQEDGPDDPTPPRTTFLQYLSSPVVTIIIGTGASETVLTAHQYLLAQSPFFAEACAQFADDGSPRQVELTGDNVDAVGCSLEFLYTGEYFPKRVVGQRTLETDPAVPKVDDTGDQLLKHARVYTLAEKFGLADLKNLASSKIHCVNSTARGEIAYARYVYEYTPPGDTAIRAPVASFWAVRSHTLRSEAEEEFRALCLQFPQFGYDVLTRVLDEKLKRERTEKLTPSGSARKRARHSGAP